MRKLTKPIVLNVSGGRSSALANLEYRALNMGNEMVSAFNNTGAEHNQTYKFLRMLHDYIIPDGIIALEGDFNQPIRKGHTVKVVDIHTLKYDPVNGPIGQIMRKYGCFTIASAWCTTRMKEETHAKYFDAKYGKGNYHTMIGIRADEPARLVGSNYVNRKASTYHLMQSYGMSDYDILIAFREAMANPDSILQLAIPPKAIEQLHKRVTKALKLGLVYFAEFSDADEYDVIQFWRDTAFDLKLDKHLGNCVFCVKKSLTKVALAARDEPEMLQQWIEAVNQANDRLNQGNDLPKGTMYREKHTIQSVIAMFSDNDRDQLAARCKSLNVEATSSCTDSCEGFNLDDL